ncbi:hypothetical protein Gotur_034361 [Gossypium turneri]
MVQCLLNEQPTYDTFLTYIFQIRYPIQNFKLVLINFSIRIRDYVSPQPRIKPQQNSFKQNRQLVRC